MNTDLLLSFVIAYLLGSVPFGLLLTRLTGKGDIRDIGSGSIGATNVLRAGGKGLAAATLLLDCLKALRELHVRLVERERRMDAKLPAEVDDGKEQVTQLVEQATDAFAHEQFVGGRELPAILLQVPGKRPRRPLRNFLTTHELTVLVLGPDRMT